MYRIVLSILIIIFLGSCTTKKHSVLRGPGVHTHKETVPSRPSVSNESTFKPNNSKGGSLTGNSYIEQYKDVAIREMNQYGIPASIKLAQALLESGNGNSYLAQKANNHFGIKCGGVWNGPSIARDDDNPNDCFRVYRSVEDSYRDHSEFLLRKRYEKLFFLNKDDYKGWAKGLKEAGYATNPRYPELLIDIIERYSLHQYDKGESKHQKNRREHRVEHIIEEKIELEPKVKPDAIKPPVAMVIHEIKVGQTLYSIARLYGVTVSHLQQINNLDGDSISIGQLLVISK